MTLVKFSELNQYMQDFVASSAHKYPGCPIFVTEHNVRVVFASPLGDDDVSLIETELFKAGERKVIGVPERTNV